MLDDLTKLNDLLSVAKQYLITDAGWNLLDFISQMRGLSLGNVTFRTLPEVAPITIDGQDANEINPAQIQQLVQETFYPVANSAILAEPHGPGHRGQQQGHRGRLQRRQHPGPGRRGFAALVKDGYKAGKVGNTSPLTTTEVTYGAGAAASASKIASLFGVTASASSTVAAGHVEVLLGADATLPSSAASPSVSPSSSAVPIPTTGPQGGAVSASNGIPCVD